MSTKAATTALCAVALFWISACGDHAPALGADAAAGLEGAVKRREAARVLVEPCQRREMVRVLETTTRVESEHEVEIFPRASGVVTAVLVEEGQAVTEGQVLAVLDSRDMRIAVDDAEVALEEAKAAVPRYELATQEAESRAETAKRSFDQASRDYARNEAIAKAGPNTPALLSPKDLDASRLLRDNAQAEAQNVLFVLSRVRIEEQSSKTAVRRAQLTLDRARLNLSHMEITAPFAGVLAARSIKTGDTLNGAATAFTLTDPTNLRAVFYRPQRELPLFVDERPEGSLSGTNTAGAEIEIRATAEARPGRTFRGKIERIAPTIDPQSGNFRVTARLANAPEGGAGAQLLPGMLVRLAIVTERRPDALVVHKRALRREGDADLVFVVREGRAVRVPVEEGLADDEYVEVLPLGAAHLDPGELVVVVGNRDLEEGAALQIESKSREIEEPAAPASVAGAINRGDKSAAAAEGTKTVPPADESATAKPAEAKPNEAKPDGAKPNEAKATETKPGESPPKEQAESDGSESAEKSGGGQAVH